MIFMTQFLTRAIWLGTFGCLSLREADKIDIFSLEPSLIGNAPTLSAMT
jgi:hypothetical protein